MADDWQGEVAHALRSARLRGYPALFQGQLQRPARDLTRFTRCASQPQPLYAVFYASFLAVPGAPLSSGEQGERANNARKRRKTPTVDDGEGLRGEVRARNAYARRVGGCHAGSEGDIPRRAAALRRRGDEDRARRHAATECRECGARAGDRVAWGEGGGKIE